MDHIPALLPYLVLAAIVIMIVVFRTYDWSSGSSVVRGLVCPRCDGLTLEVTHQMTVEDDAWDEAALQAVRCSSCEFAAGAIYEESRRGRQSEETVHHWGVPVTQAEYDELAAVLEPGDEARARALIEAARAQAGTFRIDFRVDRGKPKSNQK